jgi:hypothetical protein
VLHSTQLFCWGTCLNVGRSMPKQPQNRPMSKYLTLSQVWHNNRPPHHIWNCVFNFLPSHN